MLNWARVHWAEEAGLPISPMAVGSACPEVAGREGNSRLAGRFGAFAEVDLGAQLVGMGAGFGGRAAVAF